MAAAAATAAKCIGCAVVSGTLAHRGCTHFNLQPLAAPAATLGALAGLLGYARAWIQGYYLDRQCRASADLRGRVAVVTGGTVGGLGFAAAEILGRMGATVVLTVRSQSKGEEATRRLKLAVGHDRVSFVLVDFASKGSVRKGAAAFLKEHERLDFLVLNAGIGAGPSADVWMTNQVGPFLFTDLLTPLLAETAKKHGDVRVVAVSSGAHKRAWISHANPYEPEGSGAFAGAYGQSKLAQILHMRELQRRLRERPGLEGEQAIRCMAMTPGFALTNIVAGKIPMLLMPLVWLISRSPKTGAQPIKMACVDPDAVGGSYLSNCYVKPSEGRNGCSNELDEWRKLWELCERCVADDRFS